MKKIIFALVIVLAMFILVAKTQSYHHVEPGKCIGCTLCVQKCPVQAISMQDGKAVIDREKCIQCGLCIKACPVTAISVVEEAAAPDSLAEQPDSVDTPKQEEPSTGMIETQEEPAPTVEAVEEQIASTYYHVHDNKCIGCMVCPKSCPVDAIHMKQGVAVIDTEKCIKCGLCKRDCPVAAISVEEKQSS